MLPQSWVPIRPCDSSSWCLTRLLTRIADGRQQRKEGQGTRCLLKRCCGKRGALKAAESKFVKEKIVLISRFFRVTDFFFGGLWTDLWRGVKSDLLSWWFSGLVRTDEYHFSDDPPSDFWLKKDTKNGRKRRTWCPRPCGVCVFLLTFFLLDFLRRGSSTFT